MGKKYDAGHSDGFYEGHDKGYYRGFPHGLSMGREQGETSGHAVGYLKGFEAGKAHARKFPVDMEPQKEGGRAGQVIFDEIQPGSPMDDLYQALKQDEDAPGGRKHRPQIIGDIHPEAVLRYGEN